MNDTQNTLPSGTPLEEWYKAVNKNVVVTLHSVGATMTNGVRYHEEIDKKGIIAGIVELSDPSLKISQRSIVYFPMYAATQIKLPIFKNEMPVENVYYIIRYEDILVVEKINE